jgi:hypothetical protein
LLQTPPAGSLPQVELDLGPHELRSEQALTKRCPAESVTKQNVPPGHTLPQLPQLLGSTCGFTQAPLQVEYPELQAMAQFPPLQLAVALAGAVQTFPQAPQFLTSLLRFAHAVPQSVVPNAGSHDLLHCPLKQNAKLPTPVTEQTLPQAPQLLLSI